ncbi:MAG: Zn-ribbon domain-containing OB-fold protein [Dehalococcoidia bacterium]
MTANTREVTSYLPTGIPLPAPSPDGLDSEFWEATRRHELAVQRCGACGTFQFGPEWICHRCHSSDLRWHRTTGRGLIYSWERIWHPVHPALTNACPYVVILVELPDAGNVRIIGNLLGDPLQEVTIGKRVEAVFEDHPSEQVTLVQWQCVP